MIGRIFAAGVAFALAVAVAQPATAGWTGRPPTGQAVPVRGLAAPRAADLSVDGARPGLVAGPWRAEGAVRWLSVPGSPTAGQRDPGTPLAGLTPGATGSGWRTQRTPNPVLANGSLAAVACAGRASCVAVGGYVDQFGTGHALAERWNGTGWAILRVPDPAGAVWTGLTGVSCPSATSCAAVGWYFSAAGRSLAVAERWNGARWTVQPAPSPAGSKGSMLAGISCSAQGACTAVGQYINPAGRPAALAERWNGQRWSVQPFPGQVLGSELSGVSCPTATSCVAVGAAASASSQGTLAAHWNGATWILDPSPLPNGAVGAGFNGIFCHAPGSCVAVGDYGAISAGDRPAALAESWDGTSWANQPVPVPAPAQGFPASALFAIWCASPGNCAAVGGYLPNPGSQAPLAEALTGGTWAVKPAPDPAGSVGGGLSGVWCAAAADCHAVGADQVEVPLATVSGQPMPGRTLVEAWRGTRWAIQASPDLGGAIGFSELNAIACVSARACVAAGDYVTVGGVFAPFAEQWTGTRWLLRPMPNPVAGAESFLNGISCVSTRDCTAVGFTAELSGVNQLVERWNGVRWRVQSTPRQGPRVITRLFGISCSSDHGCVVVGDRAKGAVPFAERWDGARWRVLSIPSPAGASGASLTGVSCATAHSCAAVGNYYSASGGLLPLAEDWNGTRWTVTPAARQAGAALSGVSCTAPVACTAVGSVNLSSGTEQPVARHWNGRTWSRQPVPAASPYGSWLNAVSCTSGSCAAVGGYHTANGATVLLIDAWNGTRWRTVSTANPFTAFDSILSAVACTAPRACKAAGSDLVLTNVTVTLAMSG
jgi:hypothetical protein